MDSETLPTASSPKGVDNTEVSSQRGPGQGGARETVKAALEGQTSAAGHMGEQTPMDADGGGCPEFGPQPETIPGTNTAPKPGQQPSSTEGGAPIPPVTSVHPEVPDTLLAAMQSTYIVEEHHTLMGAVIEKVQAAKSGLTEACTSLLTGFEVRVLRYVKIVPHRQ